MATSVKAPAGGKKEYVLKLYVSGATTRSRRAVSNLNSIYKQYLEGRCDLEVVDIYQFPEVAKEADILAMPALVREFPQPSRRILGDLSEPSRVLILLDVKKTGTND